MELKRIEELLEKYWEGETSIAEERELKKFFQQAIIPAHLKIYQEQFCFFSEAQLEKIDNEDFTEILADKIMQDFPEPKVVALKPQNRQILKNWGMIGVAASLLLFVSGFFIGRNFNQPQNETAGVVDEIKRLKETVMLSMLKQESASERIKAVNYANDLKQQGGGGKQVTDALIETLNTDENTNVRIAALNALFTYKDEIGVREKLVQSIENQDDPAVKIALINMMIALKEKKAKKSIEEFLQKEPIPDKVKENLKKQLQSL